MINVYVNFYYYTAGGFTDDGVLIGGLRAEMTFKISAALLAVVRVSGMPCPTTDDPSPGMSRVMSDRLSDGHAGCRRRRVRTAARACTVYAVRLGNRSASRVLLTTAGIMLICALRYWTAYSSKFGCGGAPRTYSTVMMNASHRCQEMMKNVATRHYPQTGHPRHSALRLDRKQRRGVGETLSEPTITFKDGPPPSRVAQPCGSHAMRSRSQ